MLIPVTWVKKKQLPDFCWWTVSFYLSSEFLKILLEAGIFVWWNWSVFFSFCFFTSCFFALPSPHVWKANYFHTTGLTSIPTDAWMQAKASNEVFAKPLENDTPILKLADLSSCLKTIKNQTQLEILQKNHLPILIYGNRFSIISPNGFLRKVVLTSSDPMHQAMRVFPKIMVSPNHPLGFSIINHPFCGTPILGNPHEKTEVN